MIVSFLILQYTKRYAVSQCALENDKRLLIVFEKIVSFIRRFVEIALAFIKLHAIPECLWTHSLLYQKIYFVIETGQYAYKTAVCKNSLLVLLWEQASSDICRLPAYIVLFLRQN